MSLYNMIHGMNATLAVVASPFLPRAVDSFPRFRNIFTSAEDSQYEGDLFIYTRMGGGNYDCWGSDSDPCDCPACDLATIEADLNFVGGYDDDFDSTYRTLVFTVPEDMKEDWQAIQEGRLGDLSEAYFTKLLSMFEGRDQIIEQIEQLRQAGNSDGGE